MEKSLKNISFYLGRIIETSYSFNTDFDYSKLDPSNLEIAFDVNYILKTEENTLGVKTTIIYYNGSESNYLASYSIECDFVIDNISKHIQQSPNGIICKDENLMKNFISITVGALRGAFFIKFKGTPLEKYPIPLVATDKLVEIYNKQNENKVTS